MPDSFLLHLATAHTIPVIASLPHSGLLIPKEITNTLEASYQHYLPNQDWHLDKLYDFLPRLGITVLQAVYSRYVVDLNRSLHEPLFGSFWQSIVAEKTAFNTAIYRTPPSREKVEQRVEQYYRPYHQQLQTLLNEQIEQFGKVYLLDLHSFLGLIEDEVCLGNGNGATCSEHFISVVDTAFCSQRYQVVRNKALSGGHITRHYGQMPQVEALQIEVRYPVYLNAKQLDCACVPDWQVPEFDNAKHKFKSIFEQITKNLVSA